MLKDFVEFLKEKLSKTIEDKSLTRYSKKLTNIQGTLDKLKVPEFFSQEVMDDLSDWLFTLDDIIHDLSQSKHEKGKLSFTFTDLCSPIKSTSLYNHFERLENQLQDIATKIEKLEKHQPAIGPDQPNAREETIEESVERPYEWTTSFIDESRIIGWDQDVKEIIDPLVECKSFSTVAIVGMYGSGKTTLAQKLFTNETIKDNFPLRLWICVSPACTHEELVYRILDNLGREQDEVNKVIGREPKIGELLFILHLELLDNKYLIVFDDVWDTDDWHRDLTSEAPVDREWNDRLAYGLPKGNGSAVIVTSRREDDARRMVETGRIYRPKPLGDEDGWKLFTRAYSEAKGSNDNKVIETWEAMKTGIVNKCGGHPLALIAAAQRLAEETKVD